MSAEFRNVSSVQVLDQSDCSGVTPKPGEGFFHVARERIHVVFGVGCISDDEQVGWTDYESIRALA